MNRMLLLEQWGALVMAAISLGSAFVFTEETNLFLAFIVSALVWGGLASLATQTRSAFREQNERIAALERQLQNRTG